MRRAATIVLLSACVSTVARFAQSEERAGDPTRILPHASLVCPDALLRACCDDYCPKRPPCTYCYNRCCGCNDYCSKPCPCIPCYRAGCLCDCYCPKSCPDLCRPLVADFFTCTKGSSNCADRTVLQRFPSVPIATESDAAPLP
jgi:hypothetical protein